MSERLWKVLMPGGLSPIMGHAWPLPSADVPGEWIESSGELLACANGLHLTRRPADWLEPGFRVFAAEADGDLVEAHGKVVVRRARLLREATEEEMAEFQRQRYADLADECDDDDWYDDDEIDDWDEELEGAAQ